MTALYMLLCTAYCTWRIGSKVFWYWLENSQSQKMLREKIAREQSATVHTDTVDVTFVKVNVE